MVCPHAPATAQVGQLVERPAERLLLLLPAKRGSPQATVIKKIKQLASITQQRNEGQRATAISGSLTALCSVQIVSIRVKLRVTIILSYAAA
jgi:hypothetical protein